MITSRFVQSVPGRYVFQLVFRWRLLKNEGKEKWIGVFSRKVWILQQYEDHISYQVYNEFDDNEPSQKKSKIEDDSNYEQMLRDYFRLELNLEDHYSKWADADPFFKEATQQFYGVRILKQDLVEVIFSFICSSNNNITR